MTKITLRTLGVISTIGATVIGILWNFAKNPYGLEAERLEPKGMVVLPPIVAMRNATNHLLYPASAENTYAIHLAIPNHYIHESYITDRILKSNSASVSMYYPELDGKYHPNNANLPSCNGYCNGYVRASIEPKMDTHHAMNARMIALVEHDRQQGSPFLKFEDLHPEFGISEHFQVRHPDGEENLKGGMQSTKEYLIKRDESGKIEYIFVCSPYAASPSCGTIFSLSSRPELVVDIRFGRDLMKNWRKVIHSVDAKIVSWRPNRIDANKK